MKKAVVEIEFLRELLGTNPANENIYRDYIVGKAREKGATIPEDKVDEEVAHLDLEDEVQKQRTIFFKDEEGNPLIRDYMLLGFFKAAWRALWKVSKTESSKLKAGVSKIDRLVRVYPEYIKVNMPEGTVIGNYERTLRASTPQGDRTALASSDEVKRGATAKFEVVMLSDDFEKPLKEWLKYGQFVGLGQNRSAGFGSFKVLSIEVEDIGDFGSFNSMEG